MPHQVRVRWLAYGDAVLRRWLILLLLGLVALVGAAAGISALASHPSVRPVTQPGRLVVVSMPTLAWSQVTPTSTPALWALAKRGAVAAQATRVLTPHSCSNQSWLAFSAGAPADIGRTPDPSARTRPTSLCQPELTPETIRGGSALFPDWVSWRHLAVRDGGPADLGRIGSALGSAGQCITAAGNYAALGAANREGGVAHYTPDATKVSLRTCPVTLIGLKGPDDAYLAALERRLPPSATLVVTGMADDTRPGTTLLAVMMAGPGVRHGLLTSLSTRQPGFIQTTDLSALVLERLGRTAPQLAEGRRPVVRPVDSATGPITTARGLSSALNIEHPFVGTFFALYLGGSLVAVVVGLAAWGLARRRQRASGEPAALPEPLRWWFAVVGAMCAAMPMATYLVGLVPWWRSAAPELVLCASIIGISMVLTALALLGPWRRWVGGPMTFMIATTLFVLTQDVIHGSRLQFIALMGLQPVYGGRYYGQGNVGYAIFVTMALLLAAVVAGRMIDAGHPRVAAAVVAAIGVGAVFVDGFPSWGADGGGPIAMIPAFAYLALNAAGLALTWRRFAGIVSATVLVVGSFAVLDYLRPPRYRTHLGDFVANLHDTGQLTGLSRIWTLNYQMLTSTWLNMTVALLLLAMILALVFPDVVGRPFKPLLGRVTFLGHGLAAVAVCWLLAFFANDSGTSIPPTGLLVVIPLLVLLAASPRDTRTPAAAKAGGSARVVELARPHGTARDAAGPADTAPDSSDTGIAGMQPEPQGG